MSSLRFRHHHLSALHRSLLVPLPLWLVTIAATMALLCSVAASAQQTQEIQFGSALPVEFSCVPEGGCRTEAGALHLNVGATLRYDAVNLSNISYNFVSATGGPPPQVVVAMRSNTCGSSDSPVTAAVSATPGGLAAAYDSYGAVCVLFTVQPQSHAAVRLTGIGVRRMSTEEVSAKMMLEQVQANLIEPLRREFVGSSVLSITTRLNALRDTLTEELDRAALRFERSRNINFEAELSLAVGEVYSTANPLTYDKFNELMGQLEQELNADPVGQRYLGTLQQDLANPPSRLQSLLGTGLNLASGLLTASGYGTVANGLRALFATTFSAPSVASREGQSALQALTPINLNANVRFRDLAGLAVQLTSSSRSAVDQKLTTSATRFQELDSLLNTLERANADVNIMTDRLAEVAGVSAANETAFLSTFENLLRSVGIRCEPSCRPLAVRMRSSGAVRDSVRTQVAAWTQAEVRKLGSMTTGQLENYSVRLSSMEAGVRQLTADNPTRYELMVGTYRSFFDMLNRYLAAEKNPFGRRPATACTGTNASTDPGCKWESLAATARARVARIYPDKFNEKYDSP